MRQALVNANPDLAAANSKYVMRITGDNDEGKAQLDNFIDPESTFPVIATTSQLMTTGVDAQTCHLIVLDQRINSMTEFKQIIGRGTRINEDYNKFFFTIMDFRRATALFADPDFDGDPVQIYEPGPDDPPVPPDDAADRRRCGPAARRDRRSARGRHDAAWRRAPPRYYVDDVEVRVVTERVQYLDEDGKLITESLKDYTRKTVRKAYASLDAFLTAWNDAERKQAIIEELADQGRLPRRTRRAGRPRLRRLRSRLPCRLRPAAAHPPGAGREGAESATSSPSMATRPAPCSRPCSQKYADSGITQRRVAGNPQGRPAHHLRHPGRNRQTLRRQDRTTSPPSANSKPPFTRKPPDPCPTSPTSSKPSRTSCARTPAPTATPSASNSSAGCSSSRSSTTARRSWNSCATTTNRRSRSTCAGRNWATDDEGITGDALLDFVNNTLLPKLKALTGGGDKIAGLIRMAFEDANNYMKNGTLMRQVINKINGIDFNASDDRHMFGDIYEKLLKDLQSAGNAGEFYTPRAVTQFIVEQVNPRLGETILDPACGTGGFLTCAIEHLRKQAKTEADERTIQDCFAGIEKKHLPHVLCMTNLLLHGIDVPSNVRHDNTLARPLRDWGPKERVDVIVTNPPFGGMEEDGIEANFPAEFRTRETADLFLVLLMKILKPGGRAGLVLPDGTLFGEGVKTRIKEALLTECNLHTIVRLPNGVFNPYTGIRTNLLFFTKGAAHHRGLVLRAPLSARRQELQQGQTHPHRGVRGRARLVGRGRRRLHSPRGKRAGLARLHRPDQGRQLQPRPQEPAQPRHRPRRRGPPPARIRKAPRPDRRHPRRN